MRIGCWQKSFACLAVYNIFAKAYVRSQGATNPFAKRAFPERNRQETVWVTLTEYRITHKSAREVSVAGMYMLKPLVQTGCIQQTFI